MNGGHEAPGADALRADALRADALFDPDAPPRRQRALRVGPPETHDFAAADGVSLRLARYRGGAKGPVILSHCIGVSSLMYRTDTLPTNLLEYLFAAGFDVWLLDFRFSIELPSSGEQHSFDDVATRDYPAAVARVRELAGADTVQVVAHGVGSSTFTMAMLAGLRGVRSAVCSQVSTHLVVPALNKLKVEMRLPTLAALAGQKTMTAYTDRKSGWCDRLYDRLLELYPIAAEEKCGSPVCHRITAMYGELYEHDQLDPATHAALHELFGVVNVRAFRQLALISREGHLLNERGEDAYLPHLERLAIPITFLHGADNRCVLPRATEITYELLARNNGQGLYRRHLIPRYGHVDCIIGRNAAADVYPLILDQLEGRA
jgi:cholesterol oxidase